MSTPRRGAHGFLAFGLAVVLAYALAGCSGSRSTPSPSAAPPAAPPATAPPPATPPSGGVPRAGGPITAPWDTAAQSRETRRLHVYPEGESEISRRLLATIPEPSAAGSAAPAPPRNPAPSSPPPPPSSSPSPSPGSCWEVQILTTIDRGRAEAMRDEAERTLNVAAWVRSSGGIHRVRLGGCLTMEGAAELAERVRRSGYPEAFRAKREP